MNDDWRLQGQEKYLKGVTLEKKKYVKYRDGWEHDHCEFCSAKFSQLDGDLKEGFATEDNYRWICQRCFNDFKNIFQWHIKRNESKYKGVGSS